MPVAKATSGTFTPAPAGTFVARCFAVIALGTQPQTNPMFTPCLKVMLMWELPTETITIDKELVPMTVPKEYTLSIGKKANLRKDLESWRGKPFTEEEMAGFDVGKVLGQPCMITINHRKSASGSIRADVIGVARPLKGMEVAGQYHKNVLYEIEHGKNAVFNSLPEWIRKKIGQCEEWNPQHATDEEPAEALNESVPVGDDVPF